MTGLDNPPPWETGTPSFTATSLAKIKHSGLDEEYARSRRVAPVLSIDDMPSDVEWDLFLTPKPGMLFHWEHPITGTLVPQYRPDHPVTFDDGESGPKYMFPNGMHQGLGLLKRSEVANARVAIVEGTLQGLSFARYAPADVTVYAIAGCWGWSRKSADGETSTPVPEMSVVDGCDIMIFVDADAGTNPDVWDGASELARACTTYGASTVGFGRVPVRGTNGVDDFLGAVDEDKRAGVVATLMTQVEQKPAARKPPGKPKKLGAADIFDLPPTDDTTLGTEWADTRLNEYRVISTDKAWISYRDGRWSVEGAELEVGHSLMEFVSEASGPIQAAMLRAKGADPEKYEHLQRAKDAILSARKRQALANTAMVYRPVHVRRDELDQHPNLWCAKNKVIDLATGTVYDHTPAMLLTTGSDVEYLPGFECERFDQFLVEVLPDADVRDFVMQVFGMAMLGAVRDHVLPVMIGEGRNGKGTLIRIMLAVFGSHARVINPKALLKRKFDAHAEEIAQLAGKRLAVAEETGQGAVWDVARVNEWTGGNRLSGRFMHGNSFDFDPSHTLVMATNHRPSVGQGEQAFWDRYKEVPFEVSFFGREDYTLEPHIVSHELPGVLNRLLEASARYHGAGKLIAPAAVDYATTEAKVDADNLARFCAEHIAVTHDHELDRVSNPEAYEMVSKWWSQNVRGEVLPSTRMFPKAMRQALGFPAAMDNPRKLGQGSDSKRTWTGIRWLDGGGPRPVLTPLPQNGPGSAVIGSAAETSNPSPLLVEGGYSPEQTLGDPKKPTAANQGDTADDTADIVDHEPVVSAVQELISDDTADTAAKVVMVGLSEEEEENVDQQGVNDTCFPPMGAANRAHRQCRQSGSIEGDFSALGDALVLDLEGGSARDLYTAPVPSRYIRLAGAMSTSPESGEPILNTSSVAIAEAVVSSRLVVGHNVMHFDIPALARINPKIDILAMAREHRIFDTMIADSVLNPVQNELRPGEVGRVMKHFGLDVSAARHGVPGKTHDLKKYVKANYGGDFNAVTWETDAELQDYLRGDVRATHALYQKLIYSHDHPALPEATREYLWREHRVHAIASVMSTNGFLVDKPLLEERFNTGVARKKALTATLVEKYQIPTVKADGKPATSPAATKEGKAALVTAFESLGVPVAALPKTAKGAISFGGDPMRDLAESYAEHANGEEINALCEVIADSAGIRTVYGTALEHLHDHGNGVFKVHPSVATFQSSGRWSVTKPGLTVFGKRGGKVIERAVFQAAPGNVLMAIDLSQVDARAVAGHCQDRAYMALFDPGRDSHELVARMVWGDGAYDADPKHYRFMAKAIGHGWNYGMGIQKIVNQAKVSEETARQFDQTMKQRFPQLVAWKDHVRGIAEKPGAYMDNGFGRLMRPVPERAYNQGPALMGQGTARDIMMDCLLNIDDRAPSVIHMLRAQVHDEAIFELPESLAPQIKTFIEDCFTGEFRGVPVIAEGGCFGRSWSACYDKE